MATYQELLDQKIELERQIEETKRTEISQVIQQVKTLVSRYGLTAADCGFATKKTTRLVSTRQVKYVGPNEETWSGRGRKPSWLRDLINSGHTAEEFLKLD